MPIPDGTVFEIPKEKYTAYATFPRLLNDITVGTVTISYDGVNELGAVDGLKLAEATYLASQIWYIPAGGVTAVDGQQAIEQAASKPEVTSSVLGSTIQLGFSYNGGANNKWLDAGHNSMPSDETPLVVPFQSRLIAVTYTNSENDSDVDVEIYRSAAGQGNSDSKIYTLELRNCRTAVDRDTSGIYTVGAGDKIAVFCRDRGVNAKDVQVTLYLQVTQESTGVYVEEWSGGF